MNREQLEKPYKEFFELSEAGQYFIKELERMRLACHENAEDKPERASYYASAASALRDVLQHIQGMGIEIKKGRRARVD